jgi:hypothetical protein
MNNLDDNESLLCMHGVQSSLQSSGIVEAENMLHVMDERAARKTEYRHMTQKERDHWYDEECQRKRTETKLKFIFTFS